MHVRARSHDVLKEATDLYRLGCPLSMAVPICLLLRGVESE